MTRFEKTVKGLELLKQRLILQADVLGYGEHISDIDNALELLKAKDINVPTKWISVKDRPPTIQDGQHGIIVCDAHKNVHLTQGLISMNTDDGVILYFDDSHIDCFWTIKSGNQPKYNTLIKGNEITHWMVLPEPPKEGDVE